MILLSGSKQKIQDGCQKEDYSFIINDGTLVTISSKVDFIYWIVGNEV